MTNNRTEHPGGSAIGVRSWRSMNRAWAGVVLLAALTLVVTQTQGSLNIYILNTVLLAILGAVALNVLMGTAGQPSIGNAAFLALGSFGAMFLLRTNTMVFPLDVLVIAAFCALVGVFVGLPALRLQGLHLILATLAAHFIVIFLVTRYQEEAVGASGFIITPQFTEKGLEGSQRWWAWVLCAVASAVILGGTRLVRERSGRAWRMIRDHELIAPTLGIRPTRYKLSAFALSSAVIGAQGALLVHFTGSATVESFTLVLAIQYIAMILIGGLDSIMGAVIGAAIVTYLPTKVPEIVAKVVGETEATTKGPQVSLIIYGALIIVFIVSSPQGVIGWFKQLPDSRISRRLRGGVLRGSDTGQDQESSSTPTLTEGLEERPEVAEEIVPVGSGEIERSIS